jgi:uncharacterized membrane protein (GlpM family)
MTSLSPVEANPHRLGKTSWKEYALRFAFGGIVTALVGLLAEAFGPVVAGLFLAFPAVAIACLTLIADHTTRPAAGADALGAAAGSIGLIAFGAVVWAEADRLPGAAVLAIASIAWLVVSLAIWITVDAWRRRGRTSSLR